MITRRTLLALLTCGTDTVIGGLMRPVNRMTTGAQGISSRGATPQPRGKPSGRPFPARFTDVARDAGLTHPSIYGAVDAKSFIIEVVGCGVAFLDYDNDGWLDVFVLSGSRLESAPPGTTNPRTSASARATARPG